MLNLTWVKVNFFIGTRSETCKKGEMNILFKSLL